jgi:hypothetical protein
VEDLRCSITREDFFAPGVVMGFGIRICVSAGRGRRLEVETDLLPMCAAAFLDLRVRVSAGGLAITHLLPLAIDRPRRSSPVAARLLADAAAVAGGGLGHAESVLLLVGELWRTRAVAIGSGEAHVSEQALKAFCALHHLLLAAAAADPAVAAAADARVRRFASGPEWRTKAHEPDLGRFLPLLLLARVPWAGPGSVGAAVLQELFTRNAMCARDGGARAPRRPRLRPPESEPRAACCPFPRISLICGGRRGRALTRAKRRLGRGRGRPPQRDRGAGHTP